MITQFEAIRLGLLEIVAQTEKWGEQMHSWAEWATILGEEYGEFCEAVNETVLNNANKPELGGYKNMLKEATHTAAVAVQILEKLIEQCRQMEGEAGNDEQGRNSKNLQGV